MCLNPFGMNLVKTAKAHRYNSSGTKNRKETPGDNKY